MGLREPIDVRPADELGKVHFIAIGGSGMSGIAQLFAERGNQVSGSDQQDSAVLAGLSRAGITTFVGHDPAQVGGADTVVVSSAIRDTNPEVVAARERNIPVIHRSAALASLMMGQESVSVAGTHGKTTTTGMIVTILAAAGKDPSYVIGSPLAATSRSAQLGAGEVFVVEADESDGSFLQYPTTIAVITNIEADHLDNWETPQRYAAGFRQFASQPTVKAVVISSDDPGARELLDELRADPLPGVEVISYGFAADADFRLDDVVLDGMTAAATVTRGGQSHRLVLSVPGKHNLANAGAAFAVGSILGCDVDRMLEGARAFSGTLRRFQPIADVNDVRIYDDYAHHPTEIRAALAAARRVAQGGRLVVCFQPHLYSRTRDFAEDFGDSLTAADIVVVTDVYGSREDPIPGVTGELIADAARRRGAEVIYEPDKNNLAGLLAELVRPGDLVVTLGAGDVTLVAGMVAQVLSHRQSAMHKADSLHPNDGAGSCGRGEGRDDLHV